MPCDHPECTDEIHKTYSDRDGNELELCEAHYYWLVSGKKPSTLISGSTRDFNPIQPTARGLVTDSTTARSLESIDENPFSIDRPER